MYAVTLHLSMFSFMPDQSLNCWTMESSDIMSSTEFVTSVPSSAYHLLASWRPQDVILYPLSAALSQRMRGSIIRSNSSGERGSPWRVPLPIPTCGVWPCDVMNCVDAPL